MGGLLSFNDNPGGRDKVIEITIKHLWISDIKI